MRSLLRSLTTTGRVALGGGLGALACSALLGWIELSVLAVAALLGVALGALWTSRPQRLVVTRTLHPPKVTVGESAIGVVQVRNTSGRRMAPRMAEDVLGDQVVRMVIPALNTGESFELPYSVPARERGLFDVGPVRLARTDPLGFFRRVQAQGSVEQLWVRPRVHPLATQASGWAKDLDGPTSEAAPHGSAAFHALREYQHGDDLRHVHWRTSARRGQLMVRHFVDTRRAEDLVMLDPRAEVHMGSSFEEAVEVAASIVSAIRREGRNVHLALPFQPALAGDARLDALDRLALVQSVDDAETELLFAIDRRVARSATSLVIVTGGVDPQPLLALGRRTLGNGALVVVRCVTGGVPARAATATGLVIDVPSADLLGAIWTSASRATAAAR